MLAETVLIGLASYRLWRLVAVDTILDKPRDWLLVRVPGYIETLITCPWCLGSWVAFGVTWATDAVVGLRMPVLAALGAAVVVGALGSWLE